MIRGGILYNILFSILVVFLVAVSAIIVVGLTIVVGLVVGAARRVDGGEYNRDDWDRSGWGVTRHLCGETGGRHWDLRNWTLLQTAETGTTTTREVAGKKCIVLSGMWTDAYTGRVHEVVPSEMYIDHRVPIAEACREGGCTWSDERKRRFYRDPNNHELVHRSTNGAKSDDGPGEGWWPDVDSCGFAAKWRATKAKWALTIDDQEELALASKERSCATASGPHAACDDAVDLLLAAANVVQSTCSAKSVKVEIEP